MDGKSEEIKTEMTRQVEKDRQYPNDVQYPSDVLMDEAHRLNCDIRDEHFAIEMDQNDPLKHFRDKFFYPKCKDLNKVDLNLINPDSDSVYFAGNSLGLQPKDTIRYIQRELDKWAKCGVEGHFTGEMPWASCDEFVKKQNAKLVGAKPDEVAIMNGLSVNLHILMTAFYKPTVQRHKIMLEDKAFPSDHFAIESQIRLQGLNPNDSMLIVKPRKGEHLINHEDILRLIEEQGDTIALILFSGVHYYTGQLFDMKTITVAGHKMGCIVGFDLAHAAGNVEIKLHDWNVDFAAWCTYKYMNSSNGGIAGSFIHEKYMTSNRPHLVGWWGDNEKTRWKMDNHLDLLPGVAGYRISNPPALLVCPMLASMDIFEATSIKELTKKQFLLTGYLEYLLIHYFSKPSQHLILKDEVFIEILTPSDPTQRGNQLSLTFSQSTKQIYTELEKRGVVCDFREPDVIRVAACPLYNSFSDVYRFVSVLRNVIKNITKTGM